MSFRALSLRLVQRGLLVSIGLGVTACGEDPAFLDKNKFVSGSSSSSEGKKNSSNVEGDPIIENPNGNIGDEDTGGDKEDDDENSGSDNGNNSGSDDGSIPNFPGANPTHVDALKRCLSKWKGHPFKGDVSFSFIAASVSVGGTGNVINDTERTKDPHLVLVAAGVNVLGSPTYNLMNPNGYYCMLVGVNVITKLNINLHCNARLADSLVNVNVLSSQTGSTSAIGVDVLSSVNVVNVKPEGDKCIR